MGTDVLVSYCESDKRIAATLLRPLRRDMAFQVNFLFGYRNWRRRRSLHTSLMRITMTDLCDSVRNAEDVIGVGCSCMSYRQSKSYEHTQALFGNDNNCLRMLSFQNVEYIPLEMMLTVTSGPANCIRKCQKTTSKYGTCSVEKNYLRFSRLLALCCLITELIDPAKRLTFVYRVYYAG